MSAITLPLVPLKKPDALKTTRNVFLNEDAYPWLHALGGEARAIMGVAKPFFQVHETAHRAMAATQFTTAFTMPLSLYGIINDLVDLAKETGKNAVLDNTLSLVGDVGDLLDGIGTFASALVELDAAPAATMTWAGPLALAASLASSVFFVVHGRGIYYCNKVLNELATTHPDELLVLVKKRNYHLARQCSVKPNFIKNIVEKIHQGPAEERTDRLKQVSESIKTRIQHKLISHALGIVITLIGIVASVILFATGIVAWGIAASVILGVLFTASMGKMAFEIYSHRKFKNSCLATVPAPKPLEHKIVPNLQNVLKLKPLL